MGGAVSPRISKKQVVGPKTQKWAKAPGSKLKNVKRSVEQEGPKYGLWFTSGDVECKKVLGTALAQLFL